MLQKYQYVGVFTNNPTQAFIIEYYRITKR